MRGKKEERKIKRGMCNKCTSLSYSEVNMVLKGKENQTRHVEQSPSLSYSEINMVLKCEETKRKGKSNTACEKTSPSLSSSEINIVLKCEERERKGKSNAACGKQRKSLWLPTFWGVTENCTRSYTLITRMILR